MASDASVASSSATGLPSTPSSDAATPSPSAVPDPSSAEPSVEESDGEGSGDEPTGDGSDKPPVLDEGASGRDLTTTDFFKTPEGWRDGRFNVAGQQNLSGVAGPLSDCDVEPDEYSPTIELRLANNFSKISMKVGQGDESSDSDAVLSVKLVGNGKYLETVKVPFNKIDTLTASVEGVNALKIQIWVGGDDCTSGQIEAVLTELRVE